MDPLKIQKQDGFSIIESLVGITILGILVTISVQLFTGIYKIPELLLKREALHLAAQELNRTISNAEFIDTTYKNMNENLVINKRVSQTNMSNLVLVKVSVQFNRSKEEILLLSTYIKK